MILYIGTAGKWLHDSWASPQEDNAERKSGTCRWDLDHRGTELAIGAWRELGIGNAGIGKVGIVNWESGGGLGKWPVGVGTGEQKL